MTPLKRWMPPDPVRKEIEPSRSSLRTLHSPGRAQLGIRGQDPVVAVAVDARGRDELCERIEELEGREQELGAPVHVRFGEAVEEAALG